MNLTARASFPMREYIMQVRKKTKHTLTDISLMVDSYSDEVREDWDRQKIIEAIRREARGISEEKAKQIALLVERRLFQSKLPAVTTGLIREAIDNILLDMGILNKVGTQSVLGMPVYDLKMMLRGKTKENSNILENNPEAANLAIAENTWRQYLLQEVFSEDVALAHLRGMVHIHDLGYPRVYCSSHSLEYLKKYGLMLNGLDSHSKPAKHARTLTGHLNTFLSRMQAYYAGALGIAYLNIFYAPFLRGMDYKTIKQEAQHLIFSLSQNSFSRGGQSLFIDANIHLEIPQFLKAVPVIKNGVYTGEKYGEYEKEAQLFAKALMEIWREGDGEEGHPFSFPKMDLHINENTFKDEEQKKLFGYACEIASDNGSPYFVFDHGNEAVLSQCFTADTKIIQKIDGKIKYDIIDDSLVDGWTDVKNMYILGYDGDFRKVNSIFCQSIKEEIYEITLHNGEILKVTANHPFSVFCSKDKKSMRDRFPYRKLAKEIKVGDGLGFIKPHEISGGEDSINLLQQEDRELLSTTFCGKKIDGVRPHKSHVAEPINPKISLNFELGKFVGLFLAEGCFSSTKYTSAMRMSFNIKETDLVNFCRKFLETLHTPSRVYEIKKINVASVEFSSNLIYVLLRAFIVGKKAKEKRLKPICFEANSEFKWGLISGYFDGDGYLLDKKNGYEIGVSSASFGLMEDIRVVLTLLGITTNRIKTHHNINPRDGRLLLSYYLRVCSSDMYKMSIKGKRAEGRTSSVYSSSGVRVLKIVKKPYLGKVINFEMENIHEFYLQGIKSYNCCRLRTKVRDTYMLEHPESMRFCGFQNVTINLPQCAYRAKTKEDIFNEVYNTMEIALKAHLQRGEFVSKLLEPGHLLASVGKKWQDGRPYVDLDKATYIVGVLGLNECVQSLTGKQLHEDADAYGLGTKIISAMYLKCNEMSRDNNLHFALEESPAESAAGRLATIDSKLFAGKAIVKGTKGGYYYTNSIHYAADAPIGMLDRVIGQGKFHPIIESGAITHAFVGEAKPSAASIENFVQKVYENTPSAQITISPEFTVCNKCHVLSRGIREKCPKCNSEEVYGMTRIVGYYSRTHNWQDSKMSELKDRQKAKEFYQKM